MASTTGNNREFPKVLQNGVGNIPDADEVMTNFDLVNDILFVCTEDELSLLTPNAQRIYYITDCDASICLRIYRDSNWYALPVTLIV